MVAVVVLLGLCGGYGASPAPKDKCEQLIGVLQSAGATRKEKADACRELARVGDKRAVPVLAALLGDEEMSHMARYAMESIPDASVDKALRDALATTQGRCLVGVIGSIGVRRDAKAVDAVAMNLKSSDPEVAHAAARALGSIGTSGAAKALTKAWKVAPVKDQAAIGEGLLRCAEGLVAAGSPKDAVVIYDNLRASKTSVSLREAAVRGAIVARPHGDGLKLLLAVILNTTPAEDAQMERAQLIAALRAAQELKGSDVTVALSSAVANLPANRQVLVIETLGKRRDAAALPDLFKLAKGGSGEVQIEAIRAMPMIGDVSAVPVLSGMIPSPDAAVTKAAQESLGALQGKEADAPVTAMLTDANPARRVAGVELAGRRRMTGSIPQLFKLAEDADAKVRTTAVKTIAQLGDFKDVPAMLDLLVRTKEGAGLEGVEAALTALCGTTTNASAAAASLAGELSKANNEQKSALLRVIASVGGPEALQEIRDAAAGGEVPEVRTTAVRLLSNWSTLDAGPALLELATNSGSDTDKVICLRGYLRLAGQTDAPAEKRLEMCRQAVGLIQLDDQKKLLLASLGNIPVAGSLTMIEPYLEDAAVKTEAANATIGVAGKLLEGKGAKEAAPKVIEALEMVGKAGANADVVKRAKELLVKARAQTKA